MRASSGFLRGFLVLLGILAGATLYIILVLFPIVEDISQLRREKKDLVLRIDDFKEQSHRFFVIDQREQNVLSRERKRLMAGIPRVASISEIDPLVLSALQEIHRFAAEANLREGALIAAKDPAKLPGEARNMFSQVTTDKVDGHCSFPYSTMSRPLYLAISAPLTQGLPLLYRMTAKIGQYLDIQKIVIQKGKEYPLLVAAINLHFFVGDARVPVDMVDYAGKKGVIIDYNSDVLLERVYWHSQADLESRPLPEIPGSIPFSISE